jgi:molybdenum cofactor cytidylyltransferase
MTVAAIVLAAGASRRMGSPKPLLPWGETTLLRWELEQLQRSCIDEIVVVAGSHADEVRQSLGEARRYYVFNARWAQGRATSLARGAAELLAPGRETPEAIVVVNVDQPTRHDIVDRLVEELRSSGAEVVQPSYGGQGGHPIVLAGALLGELAEVAEATLGLRAVLNRHPAHVLAMDDEPVVRLDLDTPDTLDQARKLLGVSGPQ